MVAWPSWRSWQSRAPDFASYPAGDARKTVFFDYLGGLVDQENERWLQARARLLELREATASREPGKRDRLWLSELTDFFDVCTDQSLPAQIDTLLVHVDGVPRSLALAQAAKESAWGTSRFAADAHNYFGQRCYDKGCGVVPEYRAPGAKFEVRRFDSPQASVRSYMNNINSHPDYAGFRDYRAVQRAAGQPLNGIQAAERLLQYSERRQAYVDEIQSLIHFNQLDQPMGATVPETPEADAETATL